MNERNVVMAQACIARAMIKAMGMQAENQERASTDQAPAYVERDFLAVIEEEGIGWNTIMGLLDQ